MKQLTDFDIANMIGESFTPDDTTVKKQVRSQLKLSTLIPAPIDTTPLKIKVDFHNKTVEESWAMINSAIHSGARTITVITGASGILKHEFRKWIEQSTISEYIIEWKIINNGSYEIKVKKNINSD